MIRLVAMDIDGTLTDGGFYMDGSGNEFKRFDVRDGYGIVMLKKSGIEVAFISGRGSSATDARARDLGVQRVVNGTKDKLPHLVAMAGELGLDASEIAFIGDDIPDLTCIEWAGLGIAVADATDEVLSAADWVSPKDGGRGAVRAAAEHILWLNAQ
ncbi:HAD-IIIA family hydrolase [Synergistaceae bacterium OttesenSCG-928-I11]|nr:HAD-IIIA family hydrolase [Synergistaceae bacterium OttesenSCG-928-I11]